MAGSWNHVHVSEREVAHTWPDGQKDDGHWEDCLWCSVVEWLNETWKDVPDTLAYAEKLRDASGEPPTGGSNFGDVQRAFNRLGIPITLEPKFFPTFWSRLSPGRSGVATGLMGRFPAGHRLRRFDTDFVGGHAVEVYRPDSSDRVWWCDPLGPKTGYTGEWVTKAELAKFMGSDRTGVVRPVLPKPALPDTSTEPDMPTLATYTPGYKAVVGNAAGANVRSEPKVSTTNKIRKLAAGATETWVVIGYAKGQLLDGSDRWLVRWAGGRYEYVHSSNVKSGPTAPPDAAALVKAATDPLNAQITTLQGRITGIKKKVAVNAADVADD